MTPARSRLAPWTRAAIDALVDGPRPKRAVVAIAAATVPPGYAVRIHNRTRDNPRGLSIQHITSIGQKWVVMKTLSNAVRIGTLHQFERDGELWWELGPRARRLLTE